jgi:fermentation-respiration switch protein FrsA (DUF1100 family)
MTLLKSLLLFAVILYVGILAVMYVVQRSMMYHPDVARVSPGEAGFAEAEELRLDTSDGERVIAWHVAPRDDRPVILYLQGNGGSVRHRVERFRALTSDGFGLVALSYRGYGGSSGSPTEAGLLLDAAAAYAYTAARYPASRIVVWGESLGTGVAVALAAEQPVARLILEMPFSSTADVAAARYPFIPVRLLMKDQFRSDLGIGKVTAPVLVMHGDKDDVVPIWSAEKLFALIQAPKRFVRFPGGHHGDLGPRGAVAQARQFIREPVESLKRTDQDGDAGVADDAGALPSGRQSTSVRTHQTQ